MKQTLVKEWMSEKPFTIGPDQTVIEAHRLMTENNIRRLPVMRNGNLLGIVALSDVLEAEPSDATSLSIFELNYLLARLSVGQIMTKDPITISPDSPLREAAKIMLERKIGGLPVMDGRKLVGIITESDIFRAFVQQCEDE